MTVIEQTSLPIPVDVALQAIENCMSGQDKAMLQIPKSALEFFNVQYPKCEDKEIFPVVESGAELAEATSHRICYLLNYFYATEARRYFCLEDRQDVKTSGALWDYLKDAQTRGIHLADVFMTVSGESKKPLWESGSIEMKTKCVEHCVRVLTKSLIGKSVATEVLYVESDYASATMKEGRIEFTFGKGIAESSFNDMLAIVSHEVNHIAQAISFYKGLEGSEQEVIHRLTSLTVNQRRFYFKADASEADNGKREAKFNRYALQPCEIEASCLAGSFDREVLKLSDIKGKIER